MNQNLLDEIKKLDDYIIKKNELAKFPKLKEIITNKEKVVSDFVNRKFPINGGYRKEFRRIEHEFYLKKIGLYKKNNHTLRLLDEKFKITKNESYRTSTIESCSIFCKLYFYDKENKNLVRTKNINFLILGSSFKGESFLKIFRMHFFKKYFHTLYSLNFKLHEIFEDNKKNKSKYRSSPGLNNDTSYVYLLLCLFTYVHKNLLKENENVYIKIFNAEKGLKLNTGLNLNPYKANYAYTLNRVYGELNLNNKQKSSYEPHFITITKKYGNFISQLYCFLRKKSIFVQKRGLVKCLLNDSVFKRFKENNFDIQESKLMLETYFFECLTVINIQLEYTKKYLLNVSDETYTDKTLLRNFSDYLSRINTKREYKVSVKKFNTFVRNRQKFLRYIGNNAS
jgi:hypothetical protein